jgi:hypothetical protein
MILELLVLSTMTFYLLNREQMPTLGIAIHRAAYIGCQQAARVFGTLGMELEKSYRVKVAP